MATPDEHFSEYYRKIQTRIKDLPTTVLALAAQDVSFGEVLVKHEDKGE